MSGKREIFVSRDDFLEEFRKSNSLKEAQIKLKVPGGNFHRLLDKYSLRDTEEFLELKNRRMLPNKEVFLKSLEESSSISNMSEVLGISKHSFYKLLNKYSLKNSWEFQKLRRKQLGYGFNFDLFAGDSSNFWYLVGFLMGDGCITISRPRVRWASTDKQIIEDIKRVGGFKQNIYEAIPSQGSKRKICYELCVQDKILWQRMRDIGVPFNKSHNKTYCLTPSKGYERDFLRGFLDSDGCLRREEGKDGRIDRIRCYFLAASKHQLEWIKSYLINFDLVSNRVSVRPMENIFRIMFSSKEAYKILDHLYYPNHSLSLNRKRKKWELLKEEFKSTYEPGPLL